MTRFCQSEYWILEYQYSGYGFKIWFAKYTISVILYICRSIPFMHDSLVDSCDFDSLSKFTQHVSHLSLWWWPLDPVYTVPDPYGHDINLSSFKTSVALKFVIVLQNLIKTYWRSGKSKYVRKLTKLDVVTAWIRYRVNGVLLSFSGNTQEKKKQEK